MDFRFPRVGEQKNGGRPYAEQCRPPPLCHPFGQDFVMFAVPYSWELQYEVDTFLVNTIQYTKAYKGNLAATFWLLDSVGAVPSCTSSHATLLAARNG